MTLERRGILFTSIVSMTGAFITGITPLEVLGPYPFHDTDLAIVNGRRIVVFGSSGRVQVDTPGTPSRRRAARH